MTSATSSRPIPDVITLVSLAKIRTLPQVRTTMDPRALKELAASIQMHGLLQPIVIRHATRQEDQDYPEDNPPPYVLVAGHRRVAAAQAAGFDALPAVLVANENEHRHAELQLVENLQREDLPLADLAAGVRALYATHGKASPVAAALGKSTAWVSKHLALTSPRFNPQVRELMLAGACTDLETLHGLNQIAHKAPDPATLPRLLRKAAGEGLSRAEVRRVLASLDATAPDAEADPNDEDANADGTDSVTGKVEVKLTLSADDAAKLEALGGPSWLRRQIRRAPLQDA